MEMKKTNKKAQSHVEIILSFVIFIGFLLFVFMFMNPFAKTKPVYIMDNIQIAVINEISDEVGKLSIILNETGDCYDFNETDYDGNYHEVQDPDNIRKYDIYFNDMFSTNAPTKKVGCEQANYTLGTYSKENMIVWQKIIDLKDNYNSDYDNLKLSLGITNDFSFSLKDFAGTEIPELTPALKKIPLGIDVEAREIPIRVINSNGNILELILNIKAW